MLEQIENRTLSKRLYIPIATTPWNNISTIRISVSLRSPALTYSQLNLFHSIRLGKQLRLYLTPFPRYLPPCPLAPFVWRGKSNLRNCPHRESSKFAQPAEENFSLFSFHFFFPLHFPECASVCVCVSVWVCAEVHLPYSANSWACPGIPPPWWWWRWRWWRPRWG